MEKKKLGHRVIWGDFTTKLLAKWLKKRSASEIDTKLFIMLWEGEALKLWEKVIKCVEPKNVEVYETNHPATPGTNTFVQDTTKHLKEIKSHYEHIFSLVSQREIVIKFLNENNVKYSWKKIILDEPELWKSLAVILCKLQTETTTYSPERQFILRCLSYVECDKIKVVIIGQDPIRDKSTGLAFFCASLDSALKPEIKYETKTRSGIKRTEKVIIRKVGHSIWQLHCALRKAKLLKATEISSDHEIWAMNGILLINRYLTIEKNPMDHSDIWGDFTTKLLNKWLKKRSDSEVDTNLYIMLWGAEAQELRENVIKGVKSQNVIVYETNHPAAPNNNSFVSDTKTHLMEINNCYEKIFALEPEEQDQLVAGFANLGL